MHDEGLKHVDREQREDEDEEDEDDELGEDDEEQQDGKKKRKRTEKHTGFSGCIWHGLKSIDKSVNL